MLRKINSTIILITIMVLIGCSGSPSSSVREYRITVGTATLDDFMAISDKILNRNRFVIDRTEDRGLGAAIECKYEYPPVSNQEALRGIQEIRYQLILESRIKGSGGGMYSVRAIVRSYGRFSSSEEWVDIPANDETKRRVKLFANELKIEFENKIRVF